MLTTLIHYVTLTTVRPGGHGLEMSIAPFGVADIWTIGNTSDSVPGPCFMVSSTKPDTLGIFDLRTTLVALSKNQVIKKAGLTVLLRNYEVSSSIYFTLVLIH